MSSSSNATTANHEWLPMPSGISLTAHNSFTTDLLRQFDKRRSQLNFDITSIKDQESSIHSRNHSNNTNHPVASSIINTSSLPSSSSSIASSIRDQEEGNATAATAAVNSTNNITNKTKSSAGNLLRKSSVYLRNKFNDGFHHNNNSNSNNNIQQIEQPRASTIFNSWTLKKKKKFHIPTEEVFNQPPEVTEAPQQLSKIAINTTINISSMNNNRNINHLIDTNTTSNIIQPPIITQYPPKPLKYSPVEPLPVEYAGTANHINSSSRRKTLHRLSLPLLRLTAASQQLPTNTTNNTKTIQRRRSDSDLLNQQESSSSNDNNNNVFHSLSKQWNKLLFTCKKRGVKKKKVTL